MNKIKILHIIRPAAGGMKNHLINLIRHTDKNKFSITVACPPSTALWDELYQMGVNLIPIPLAGEISLSKDYAVIRTLVKYLHQSRTTIMHAHSSKAALVGRIAGIIARTPVIVFTAHNSIFYEEWPGWKKKIYATVEKILARFTDRIITVSDALKQELVEKEEISLSRLTTIYNGIEIEKFNQEFDKEEIKKELKLPPSGVVIGTIARLAPQKGVAYLLKAASLLKEYNITLLIVGDGPLRQQLEEEALELGLGNRAIFAGMRENIEEIYAVLDIFVLPSVTEGLPLAILEAMAAAKPVVATRVGGVPEAILEGKTGLVVSPKDPEALAVALAGLLGERELLSRMGKNGLKHVNDKFTITLMVQKTLDLYSQLLLDKNISVDR
ncbi:glycosyltransferase family 4 protein [Desulfotomaculum sp. 1211_IL3151]|uniref:glycosyltransferase family 4 protein n=1 Tax=Desulfotomaculum sp. 1211_IL3151 TaxID=3084055 RepID=UPI002FDB0968